ncbi:MAG: hypothetical protein GY847_28390 [Proteobacteria bacterium]|nr:hypothetical protein [Pseudomonadota bacterium]
MKKIEVSTEEDTYVNKDKTTEAKSLFVDGKPFELHSGSKEEIMEFFGRKSSEPIDGKDCLALPKAEIGELVLSVMPKFDMLVVKLKNTSGRIVPVDGTFAMMPCTAGVWDFEIRTLDGEEKTYHRYVNCFPGDDEERCRAIEPEEYVSRALGIAELYKKYRLEESVTYKVRAVYKQDAIGMKSPNVPVYSDWIEIMMK